MPLFAQFPSWMMFVLIMMFMGPMMHMIFGGKRNRWWKDNQLEGGGRQDVRRLENALAERDLVLEDLQHRLSELESRLDFSERLLAERRESPELPVR